MGAERSEGPSAEVSHRQAAADLVALKVWAADQFAYDLVQVVAKNSPIAITNLYRHLHEHVAGSHVQVFNEERFGDAAAITLDEFVVRKSR